MVKVISTTTDIKVEDTDGIHLLNLRVELTQLDMFRDRLGNTEKNTFQIINLTGILNLHNNDLVFAVTRLYVDTVEFIRFIQLIAFTLQNLDDTDGLTQQNGEKTLQHAEIGLVTQQALHRPIKTNIPVFLFHHIRIISILQI